MKKKKRRNKAHTLHMTITILIPDSRRACRYHPRKTKCHMFTLSIVTLH